ncbi:unnamed protein product [Periconia digitata]|uniref:Protein kinase domain-containing protein n=1 Tax=Periconia digitata TaxID=1303443 RepID=A0A9W4U8H9_9PLEO|nr:unnamed protein product [Periconia digitata]
MVFGPLLSEAIKSKLTYQIFHTEQNDSADLELIVLASNNTFYHTTIPFPKPPSPPPKFPTNDSIKSLPLSRLSTRELTKLFPRYHPTLMTRAPEPHLLQDPFIKRQRLIPDLHMHEGLDPDFPIARDLLSSEIGILETLRAHPHPNIAEYHGVLLHPFLGGSHVTDILYTRYATDLDDFYANPAARSPANSALILNGVKAAIAHLHSLGIAHHDVRPANIFLDVEGFEDGGMQVTKVVLGDFDAAVEFGKGGWSVKHAPTGVWWDEELWRFGMVVDGEMDLRGLRVLERWLDDTGIEGVVDAYA